MDGGGGRRCSAAYLVHPAVFCLHLQHVLQILRVVSIVCLCVCGGVVVGERQITHTNLDQEKREVSTAECAPGGRGQRWQHRRSGTHPLKPRHRRSYSFWWLAPVSCVGGILTIDKVPKLSRALLCTLHVFVSFFGWCSPDLLDLPSSLWPAFLRRC